MNTALKNDAILDKQIGTTTHSPVVSSTVLGDALQNEAGVSAPNINTVGSDLSVNLKYVLIGKLNHNHQASSA